MVGKHVFLGEMALYFVSYTTGRKDWEAGFRARFCILYQLSCNNLHFVDWWICDGGILVFGIGTVMFSMGLGVC